jgi:hypothetical protein
MKDHFGEELLQLIIGNTNKKSNLNQFSKLSLKLLCNLKLSPWSKLSILFKKSLRLMPNNLMIAHKLKLNKLKHNKLRPPNKKILSSKRRKMNRLNLIHTYDIFLI